MEEINNLIANDWIGGIITIAALCFRYGLRYKSSLIFFKLLEKVRKSYLWIMCFGVIVIGFGVGLPLKFGFDIFHIQLKDTWFYFYYLSVLYLLIVLLGFIVYKFSK